ncbi:MAG: glycosyltransferase family 4 protein [Pseudomonas sp.]
MKVLIALTYYVPYVSGVTEFARMLAEHLALSHEVTILTTHHDPSTAAQEMVNGVRVVRSPVLAQLHKGVISPRFVLEFVRLAKEHDVVNLHLPMLEAGVLAYLCESRRLVTTYQCDMAATGGLIDRLAVHATRISARIALGRAARIVVTTMDYALTSQIARRGGEKLIEVSAPLKKPPESFKVDPESNRETTAPRIGFVGRFVQEKGLSVLLVAFKALRESGYPSAKLVLVGQSEGVAGGSVINSIDSAIRALGESVEMRGKVSETELWQIYGGLDVLVLPSINRYEAFGMVQLEAMMAGALVVATDLPGVRTIVQNTGCGAVARTGDAASLFDALCDALSLRAHISRAEVAERVIKQYPPEGSVRLQETLLLKVIEEAG